jgi:tetratricopeptide (TPR) repeat protein
MARVRSDAPRTVALKVWCTDSFAVFVNGRECNVSDRIRDRVPSPVWTTARLESGWNRVLVKIAGRARFAIKFADAKTGDPLRDIEAGDPLMSEPEPHADGAPEARGFKTATERAIAAAESSGDARAAAAAALLLGDEGREWEAYTYLSQAAAAAPALAKVEQANMLASHGRFLATFNELPPIQRKLRAKESFAAALAAVPAHHSATLRMARYDNEDDKPDAAVNALQKYAVENPTPMVWMTIAEIAKARTWEREAIDAAEAALALAPNHADAVRFLAAYDRQYGNTERHADRMRRLIAIDAADSNAHDALIRDLRARGQDDAALARLQELSDRWPASIGYRRQIGLVLRNLGRLDESLAVWRELGALVPQEESYARDEGAVLELQGKTDEAIAAYERSLALQGYQPNLWRALKRLRGQGEDFAKRFEPNVEQILAELPSDEELTKTYPKAVALTLLDHSVVSIHPDGSASSIVHMVYKVLNEKGVAKYGDLPNAGELLDIRTILPDGTVMTPTGLGRRSYNMEGLVPGVVIQHRYLVHQRAGRKGYDGGQFFFQDFEFRGQPNPVFHSRYVVIADSGSVPTYEKRNYGGDAEVVEFDGKVATIFEKRDMPRIEWEQGMPPKEEIVPYVDYSPAPTMDDANWELLAGRDDTRTSPVLRDALTGVIDPEMGDTAKLHAIYDFVNTTITGEFGMGGSPASILLEKAGDREQLFEAMVREAGIPYTLGRAMAWNGHARDLTRPTSNMFNAAFLYLQPRDGKPMPFFMGARHAPFGLVPPPYRGSFAFLCSEDGGRIVTLPAGGPRTDNGARFDVTLGADAEATRVGGDVVYRSGGGYRFKRQLEEMSQDDRRKFAEGQLSGYFASPTLSDFAFPGVESRGEPLTVYLQGTMPQYLSPQGDRFVAGLGLPTSDMTSNYVHRPTRLYDLILNVRDEGVDEYTVELGDAFEIATLPADHLAVNELGTYSLTFRLDGTALHVRRERHLQPARYTPEQYGGFVAWCKAIDDAEQAKIEFRAR